MSAERWRRLETIYHAALARSPADRAGYLIEACSGDEELRGDVESLLVQNDTGDRFLEAPAALAASDLRLRGRSELTSGSLLSHYQILEPIGAGGMGAVFRAVDTRLHRTVAVKVVAHDGVASQEWRRRFITEARSASAFTHPNIVTIHEVDAVGGIDFIVMELVAGDSIAERIRTGGLPIDEVLTCAAQVASALNAAHTMGIVHRDIKPANIMVTASGQVKVLDFGIAKQLTPLTAGAAAISVAAATNAGVMIGSLPYMSPEQAHGRAVDGRSDVFSFGVVLYEMLTGSHPFSGTTGLETVAKILEFRQPPARSLRKEVPAALSALVQSCLEKQSELRPSAVVLHERLASLLEARTVAAGRAGMLARRRAAAIALLGAAAVAGCAGLFLWASGRDVRKARQQVPEIMALAERYDYDGFYRAARDVVPVLPDDQRLKQSWLNLTNPPATIDSTPPGAEVEVKGYAAADAAWIPLGRTPIRDVRTPFGLVRLRVSKNGYVPLDVTLTNFTLNYTLDPAGSVPEGMVRVTANAPVLEGTTFRLPDYWMDRFEVTNQQFKAFVDAGGYRNRKYWHEPLMENGRTLTWDEAIAGFVDKTGRPGPSTWELGTFLEGQAEFPVAGVSWFEAAAYAVFAGRSLPTAYQWRGAGDFTGIGGNFGDILTVSNFGQKGPAAVGSHSGVGSYGTYDMAGNVKEWCWNESAGGRMILGGSWNEPTYMFDDRDAQPPWQRLPEYGFRLAQNIAPQPPDSYGFVERRTRDYDTEKPVTESVFTILRNLYQYDPRPLNATVDEIESAPDWRRETVTLDVPYGNERLNLYLYLPKSASPPYQTVVYFPGGDAQLLRSSRDLRLTETDFIIRSGRALLYPVYQGTYERQADVAGINAARDVTIARGKDFGRVLEFIDSRPDLDHDRIGYYGLSLGAFNGVIFTALNPRLKASVLLGGGLLGAARPPEIDLINFAPRIRTPSLMINGRSDFTYPLESSQRPLFRLIGTPADRKRHALLEGGHIPARMHEVMREILDWFDRYLGPLGPAG